MSTVVLNGTVLVPGTPGMSIATTPAQPARPARGRRPAVPAKPAMLDVTLRNTFSADIPIASVQRVSPSEAAVASEVAVLGGDQVQFEDMRSYFKGMLPTDRVYPIAQISVYATLAKCVVAVDFGDGQDSVEYVGPWQGTPTIKVDGVSLIGVE